MHTKRGKVIKTRFHEDPGYWQGVHDVYQSIGLDGMSSDETETDAKGKAVRPKQVRRVEKPWVSSDITAMWEHVDDLGVPGKPIAGNRSLHRIHEAHSTNASASPVRGLPGNYYNALWYLGRQPNERAALRRKKDKPIPSAVRFIHPSVQVRLTLIQSSFLTDNRDKMRSD